MPPNAKSERIFQPINFICISNRESYATYSNCRTEKTELDDDKSTPERPSRPEGAYLEAWAIMPVVSDENPVVLSMMA